MSNSARFTSEEVSKSPLLIIDTKNQLGYLLAQQLRSEFHVVYVTKHPLSLENVQAVHYQAHKAHIPHASYAYTLFVYSGNEEELLLVPSLYKKAIEHNGRLLCIMSLDYASEEVLRHIKDMAPKAYLIVLGDVFGFVGTKLPDTGINNMLATSKSGRLLLPNVGMLFVYPLSFADAVEMVVRLMFSKETHTQTYLAFPRSPVTMLSLARSLLQQEPLLKIDFVNETAPLRNIPSGVFAVQLGRYHKQIQDVFGAIDTAAAPHKKEETVRPTGYHKRPHVPIPSLKQVILLAFFVFILFPFVASLLCGLLGFVGYEMVSSAVQEGNIGLATVSVQEVKLTLDSSLFFAQLTKSEFGLIGQQQVLVPYVSLLTSAEQGAQGASVLLSAYRTFSSMQTNQVSKDEFVLATDHLRQGLDSIEGLLSQNALPQQVKTKLSPLLTLSPFITNTSSVWPQLFGFSGKQTYLVVFQNNMELRPTGGFIGSYGLLTLDKGKVTDFTIHDVYDGDGKLKQHIEPPWQIRRFIPQVHLYLRDSNFSPDFPRSASTMANMLALEDGIKVQGVIAIDLPVVQSFIAALGSVYVPEYNETITKDNFFLLTESHVEKQFFPGSTQKKDFLRALFAALERKVQEQPTKAYAGFGSRIMDNILNKDILFAFSDPSIQDVFAVNGYSDTLSDTRVAKSNTVLDFAEVNEANIGANKVNYFIKRQLMQKTAIDGDGNITEVLRVNYKNTSTGVWPGGAYKNYVRFILPQGAVLQGIAVNGQGQHIVAAVTDFGVFEQPGFLAPNGLEVEQISSQGKTIIGMLLQIPPGAYQNISVTYTLPDKIDVTAPDFYFDTLLAKQPGTNADPLTYAIQTPGGYALLPTNGVFDSGNSHSLTTHLATDLRLQLHFVKN